MQWSKNIIWICTVLACFGAGCELIVLGTNTPKRTKPPVLNQSSSEAVVRLFKSELDSNNVIAALHLFSQEDRPLLAIEKYDLREEVARYGRLMGNKPITMISIDTLSETKHRVKMECNYIKEFTFTTVKLDEFWFIAAVAE